MSDKLFEFIKQLESLIDLRLILPHWNQIKPLLKKENIVQFSFKLFEITPLKMKHLYASLIMEYLDENQFSGMGKFEEYLKHAVGRNSFIIFKKQRKKKKAKKFDEGRSKKTKAKDEIKTLSSFFRIPWVNVRFGDGFITIKCNNHIYKKYIEKSKRYFNDIKHYYSFHNTPELEVEIFEYSIKSIKNEEVLFYHINFFTFTATSFGILNTESFQLRIWAKYNKRYYKSKLPYLFHKESLEILCEMSDLSSPIIPVGEIVKSNSGATLIHNSFLFPIKSKYANYIIWESSQANKATYVFLISLFSQKNIQPIFDYIRGDADNKRLTLIRSKELQEKLGLLKRIAHSDLSLWKLELRYTCGIKMCITYCLAIWKLMLLY